MSWKQEDHSGYSFSEYQYSPPSGPELETASYTDPRFYQPRPKEEPAGRLSSYPPEYVPPVVDDGSNLESVYASEQPQPTVINQDGPFADSGQSREQEEAPASGSARKRGLASLGSLGAIVAMIAKFGVASISALVSIGVYSLIFGWSFAIGLVALLFLHEMGHALVMKLKGMPIGGMVFIPMLGAAVFMNRMPRSAQDEAEVGIAGPIAGALASAVCLLLAQLNPFSPGIWASLAYFGFFMNLFNLIPVLPFDGGRVLAAIDRRIWIIGFVGLIAIQIWEWVSGTNSIWLLLFIVMAATQFFVRSKNTPEAQAYYTVPLRMRITLGIVYFGLAAFLVLGMSMAHSLIALNPGL